MVTAIRKSTIDTDTKNEIKHNIKVSNQITREKNKRDPRNKFNTNLKNDNKNIHINNYLKCKWIKCSNQKTDWLNRFFKTPDLWTNTN